MIPFIDPAALTVEHSGAVRISSEALRDFLARQSLAAKEIGANTNCTGGPGGGGNNCDCGSNVGCDG